MPRYFEGAEVDTLEYSRDIAYSYVGRMRSKKNKAYAKAYLAYIEGRRTEPEPIRMGVDPKAAHKIRTNVGHYRNKLTGRKPTFGIL
jgi:hypothetical protein